MSLLKQVVPGIVFGFSLIAGGSAQTYSTKSFPIAKGWAKNQINAVIFRRNSVISRGNIQYAAFYDAAGSVVLASRKLGTSKWVIRTTKYRGDLLDAHKSISITVDGAGYIHMVWNQHDSRLQYCRGLTPGSLDLSIPMPMTNQQEARVTYPEFYNLPNGDLLFLYRDGSSGRGNLILNRYDLKTRKWVRLQDNLIDGENTRSAYWQAAIDSRGTIHISWVWRETPDVASNHDLCYARSVDGGRSWEKSAGQKYQLPITAESAEYILRIPQRSELINQTSMTADSRGRPYIATYWKPAGSEVPQYHLIYHDGRQWKTSQITKRTLAFSLSGVGTKRIPISRPQVIVGDKAVVVIYRDLERADRISVAISSNLATHQWAINDLNEENVGQWEPTFDPISWQRRQELHLFVQKVGQGDAEGVENIQPQMISVLEWRPTGVH